MLDQPITLPLWAVLLAGLFAVLAVLDKLLVPSVRWYFRRRVNRVIDELNERLDIKLTPFTLTKRQVLIDRLAFDPMVLEAVDAEAHATGEPRDVVMARVGQYAREIVPSFNAYLYFRVGYWFARRLVRRMYRVRLGYAAEEALGQVDENDTIVFVMNHRLNMDYVLVAFLAADRTALSYACLLYTSPSPRDRTRSRMPASA